MTVALLGMFFVFGLALSILFGLYNIFEKAGEPGWQAFIPGYNIYRLFKVAGLAGWWMLGIFVPFINLFVYFSLGTALAERFGRSQGFAAGVCLFPWLFLPWLGYSNSVYTPAEGEASNPYLAVSEYDYSEPPMADEYPETDEDDDIDDDGIERISLEDW